jgi:hypothetical protein
MSGQCDDPPVSEGPLSVKPQTSPTWSSSAAMATMPTFDFSSYAMYPTVIAWVVLGIIGLIFLIFLFGYATNQSNITDMWSLFVWGSFIALLASLAIVNASFNRMLINMNMCKTSMKNFLQVSMSTLAVATILLSYILYYDFGTNQNIRHYLVFMLHVNLLTSIINLCMVTMQQLSTAHRVDAPQLFTPK